MSDSDRVLKMRLVEFADIWDVSLLCVMFEVRGGLPGRVGRRITGVRLRREVGVGTERGNLSAFRRDVVHGGCLPHPSPQTEKWKPLGNSQAPGSKSSSSCYSP